MKVYTGIEQVESLSKMVQDSRVKTQLIR